MSYDPIRGAEDRLVRKLSALGEFQSGVAGFERALALAGDEQKAPDRMRELAEYMIKEHRLPPRVGHDICWTIGVVERLLLRLRETDKSL